MVSRSASLRTCLIVLLLSRFESCRKASGLPNRLFITWSAVCWP
jgi:hypothetical protein